MVGMFSPNFDPPSFKTSFSSSSLYSSAWIYSFTSLIASSLSHPHPLIRLASIRSVRSFFNEYFFTSSSCGDADGNIGGDSNINKKDGVIVDEEVIFCQQLILPTLHSIIGALASFCASLPLPGTFSPSSPSLSSSDLSILIPLTSELLNTIESIIKRLTPSQIGIVVSPLLKMVDDVWDRFVLLETEKSPSSSSSSSSLSFSSPFAMNTAKEGVVSVCHLSSSGFLVLSSLLSVITSLISADGGLRQSVEVSEYFLKC
jgi:hypothetical protein